MRCQPKMPAGDREVGGDGEFLAAPGTKQGAVVAYSQPHLTARERQRALADLPDE